MTTYAQALKSIADKPNPAPYAHMTKEQIEAALADISAAMKGPMPNVERALLFADRVDLRAALAKFS